VILLLVIAWQDWKDAVDLGADFYDGDGDGVYNPVDKTAMVNGILMKINQTFLVMKQFGQFTGMV
jgi:hypothetical protein